MTTQEFSNEFDVLYNNIASNSAPGLNEYEKSVFLTKAQSEIVKAYFTSTTNKSRSGFDGDEKRQYDFSVLLRTANLYNINTVKDRITELEKIDRRSKVFLFPEDYFLSVNEIATDNNQFYSIIPITYTDYQKMMTKPYPYPPKRALWRLITDKKNCNYVQKYLQDTADFKFLTTWADQKRTLSVTIIGKYPSTITEEFYIGKSGITFLSSHTGEYAQVVTDGEWSDDNSCYNVTITVNYMKGNSDDKTVVALIKEGFNLLTTSKDPETGLPYIEGTSEIAKVARRLDCFNQCEAPSQCTTFTNYTGVYDGTTPVENKGYTFTTETIQLPMAELIGKTGDNLQYQMRYIKRPKPIVLENLSNGVSIEGVQTITECELAEELHPEILQRAVELAKAAYMGDLTSTISVGNASATNLGLTASNNQ